MAQTDLSHFDLIVIGGGPAGVTAALRARELGASVALIERRLLGGTCTNDGCVPTRVLAKAARLMRDSAQWADYGLLLDCTPRVDFATLLKRTQAMVYAVHEKKQLLDHLYGVGVTVFDGVGNAEFTDAHTVRFGDATSGRTLTGDRFIICAGGHARRLPLPGAEHTLVHSDVWEMDHLPESMIVVGGGATGCQLASVFRTFGAEVTIIDIAPRILLTEDDLVASTVAQEFTKAGMHLMIGIGGIERFERRNAKTVEMVFNAKDGGGERRLAAEAILLSVGWPGNVESLGLEAAGVTHQKSYIGVDEYLATSQPHIYAAGDINGRMMLVQSAGSQARFAVENALGEAFGAERCTFDNQLVPHGGFTDPEYGGVGVTEVQARANAANPDDVMVAVVPYADMDRAVIDGHPVGFCKLIVDRPSELILGAHVVGEQAVELVQMVAAGMASGMRVQQLAELEIAYPTFASVVGLAARQLVREIGTIRVTPEWIALRQVRGAEWERIET